MKLYKVRRKDYKKCLVDEIAMLVVVAESKQDAILLAQSFLLQEVVYKWKAKEIKLDTARVLMAEYGLNEK